MTPILAASILTVVVLGSWHGGKVLERFLRPDGPAWPLTRRLVYALLAFEMVRFPLERVLRAFL